MNTCLFDLINRLPLKATTVATYVTRSRGTSLLRLGSLLLLLNNMSGHQGRTEMQLTVGPQCGILGNRTSTSVSILDGAATVTGVTEFGYLIRTSPGGQGRVDLSGHGLPGLLDQQFRFSARLNGIGLPLSQTVSGSDSSIAVVRFGPNSHTPREGSTGRLDWQWKGPEAAWRNATLAPRLMMFCE